MTRYLLAAVLAPLLHSQSGEFALTLAGTGPFHEREAIPAAVTLPGREWQFAGLIVDPPQSCGTQATPCTGVGMQIATGLVPRSPAGEFRLTINQYLPELAPGRYRVSALIRRLTFESTPQGTIGRYAEPPDYRVSPAVEVTIIPANAEWRQSTMAEAASVLSGPEPRTAAEYDAREAAVQRLASLDTEESREQVLALLPQSEGTLLAALANSREPAQVCRLLQSRVSAPAQAVSTQYLYTTAQLCAKVDLPPAPAPSPGAAPRRLAVAVLSAAPPVAVAPQKPDPAMEAWQARYTRYTESLWDRLAAALASSLSQKDARVRSSAFDALLQRASQLRLSHRPAPPWTPSLTAEFTRSYRQMDPNRRRILLDQFSLAVRSPALVPLLESILDAWKPGEYYEEVHSAIRVLNAIDPARAQSRLRAELTREQTWLDLPQLDLLPASAVTGMDDALINALAESQRPGGWNPHLRMAALALYAGPAVLPRLRAIYESQQDCAPELLAYFVRTDTAYADRVFRSHPWDMQTMPPRCTVQYFTRIPQLAMSPGLEAYLSAYLMHSDVYLKTTAAEVLGRHGSADVQPALWSALRYFQEWWKDKPAELEKNGQAVHLESVQRNAIARGAGWLARDTDLRRLEALCSTSQCRYDTAQDLAMWAPPLRVEVREGYYRVAQYTLPSLAALKSKLAQFPPGTSFTYTGDEDLIAAVQ